MNKRLILILNFLVFAFSFSANADEVCIGNDGYGPIHTIVAKPASVGVHRLHRNAPVAWITVNGRSIVNVRHSDLEEVLNARTSASAQSRMVEIKYKKCKFISATTVRPDPRPNASNINVNVTVNDGARNQEDYQTSVYSSSSDSSSQR